MSRIKRAIHARKKKAKYFQAAKGYRGGRRKLLRTVMEAVDRARCYAYRDRKDRKREFRRLWILRINAAIRGYGMNYSEFIYKLKKNNIRLDRKELANIAYSDTNSFAKIVEKAKSTT